jgi:hypothetical protein
MTRPRILVAVALLAAGALLALPNKSADLPEGLKDYTPTRIEWAAVELNSFAHQHLVIGEDAKFSYDVTYTPSHEDPNTIEVDFAYTSEHDPARVHAALERTKNIVRKYAKSKHWDWMKVQERVTNYSDQRKESK